MGTKVNKSLILNKIKLHYNFKSDAEFARFLEIKPNSLANWYSRNTMDYERVFSKCEDIDANWLLSGEGEMLREYGRNVTNEYKILRESQEEYKKNKPQQGVDWQSEYLKEKERREDVYQKYVKLLEKIANNNPL
ncbi:helix-turn-helix domain-containing protein [Sphingobacterium spiritivorum]|uniref:helix-turn-helix domain-containing protein n=1 Tax=Sphingobacterium spiritivorum TaxID=258 RepID=UPI003DA2AC3F